MYGKIVGLAVFITGKDIVAFPDGNILICRAIESGRGEVTILFIAPTNHENKAIETLNQTRPRSFDLAV